MLLCASCVFKLYSQSMKNWFPRNSSFPDYLRLQILCPLIPRIWVKTVLGLYQAASVLGNSYQSFLLIPDTASESSSTLQASNHYPLNEVDMKSNAFAFPFIDIIMSKTNILEIKLSQTTIPNTWKRNNNQCQTMCLDLRCGQKNHNIIYNKGTDSFPGTK